VDGQLEKIEALYLTQLANVLQQKVMMVKLFPNEAGQDQEK
jgi:hypothetical protein